MDFTAGRSSCQPHVPGLQVSPLQGRVHTSLALHPQPSVTYMGMTISAKNLALLPTDGQVEVTVIQVPEDPKENDEDLCLAAAQRDSGFLKGTRLASRLPRHVDDDVAHHCGSEYDFAQRIFRFIEIYRRKISQSPSLSELARVEALSCLEQWAQSLQEAEFHPYASLLALIMRRAPRAKGNSDHYAP